MRVHARPLAGLGDADQVEHLDGPLERLLLRQSVVDPAHLGDLTTDGVHRVEGRERVLEDHRDLAAPQDRCSSARHRAGCSALPHRSSPPSIRTVGSRPMMVIAVTDLPEPDSPTIENTSPRWMSKETPSTARTTPVVGGEARLEVADRQQRLAGVESGVSTHHPSSELRVEGVTEAVADEHEGRARSARSRGRGRTSGAERWPGRPCPATPSAPTPGSGSCGPTPRNDSAASARIATTDDDGAVHDDRLEGVGQDVAEHDPHPREPERLGRLDVLELLERQEGRPHDAGDARASRSGRAR